MYLKRDSNPRLQHSKPGTSGRPGRVSLIWPATYSFNIILALSYIVVGIVLDCKPTPVPGLLILGSKKIKGSFDDARAWVTLVNLTGSLLVSEALHAVNASFQIPFELSDSCEFCDGCLVMTNENNN